MNLNANSNTDTTKTRSVRRAVTRELRHRLEWWTLTFALVVWLGVAIYGVSHGAWPIGVVTLIGFFCLARYIRNGA